MIIDCRFTNKKFAFSRYAICDIRNNHGSTAILLTVLILTSVLTVTLVAAEIGQSGIIAGRQQNDSTRAYFAAEAGAERVLNDVRNGNFVVGCSSCLSDNCVKFNSDPALDTCVACNSSDTSQKIKLSNDAYYMMAICNDVGNIIHATSTGSFGDVNRVVVTIF